jgi:hypothetical protein
LDGFKNLIGPVIRLRRLSDDELLALIVRITKLYAQYYHWDVRISFAEMQQFLQLCLTRAGADSMITPREMLRDYMTLMNILMQNEHATFAEVVGKTVTLRTDDEIHTASPSTTSKPNQPRVPKFNPEDIEF